LGLPRCRQCRFGLERPLATPQVDAARCAGIASGVAVPRTATNWGTSKKCWNSQFAAIFYMKMNEHDGLYRNGKPWAMEYSRVGVPFLEKSC